MSTVPAGASIKDLRGIQEGIAKIKADLLSELIGVRKPAFFHLFVGSEMGTSMQVSILRSEFDAAEKVGSLYLPSPLKSNPAGIIQNLALLVAHTRNTALFPAYSARVTLHYAHLAHALGQTERARTCYRVAERVAKEGQGVADGWVEVAAAAGCMALEIGLARGGASCGKGKGKELSDAETEELRTNGMVIVKACKGMGGTLEAVGRVLEASLVEEILGAK